MPTNPLRTWRIAPRCCAAWAAAWLLAAPAWAQDETDRLSSEILKPAAPAASAASAAGKGSSRVFAEVNGEQATSAHPAASSPASVDTLRGLADARLQWGGGDGLQAQYSGRFTLYDTRGGSDAGAHARHDLREALVGWQGPEGTLLRAGRINLRNGVALGYNPTDFFGPRTAIDTTTRDPSALRENRLGTVLFGAQQVLSHGSLALALAPKLADPQGLAAPAGVFNAALGRTNDTTRGLLKASYELADDFAPELVLFKQAGQGLRWGGSLTRGIGTQWVVYGEYASARRSDTFNSALDFGSRIDQLPPSTAALGDERAAPARYQDLALGATWASEYQLTMTLEVDWHQAGWTREQWQRWFALGAAPGAAQQGLPPLLRYVRNYAAEFQEPLAQRSMFFRLQKDNVVWRGLSVGGLAVLNTADHSTLWQWSLDYAPVANQRVRALWIENHGTLQSQYGSDPVRRTLFLAYSLYI